MLIVASAVACWMSGEILRWSSRWIRAPAALTVTVLPAIDPNLIVDASVDTSGVMQQEEQLYPATVLVNGVKTDFGNIQQCVFLFQDTDQ